MAITTVTPTLVAMLATLATLAMPATTNQRGFRLTTRSSGRIN